MFSKYKLISYRIFSLLFFTTGLFAFVGSLFCWGEGWLFEQTNLLNIILPLADLILTAPLSILTAYGIASQKYWGIYLGIFTSGIYSLGSILVFILVIWNGSPYPLQLIIPPIFGLSISILYVIWVLKNYKIKFKTKH